MKVETQGPVGRRRPIRALFTLPGLTTAVLATGICLFSLLVGVIVGLRITLVPELKPIADRLQQSALATELVIPALRTAKAVLIDGDNVPLNFAVGLMATDVDHLSIDIKWEDYQRLDYNRQVAMERGVLVDGPDDYVPATIQFRGQSIEAKLRLKGDLPDHWATDKWSLRIHLTGDQAILGAKRFSIQRPETREFVDEWVGLEAMRREGLLAPTYHFLDVTINGKAMGIYAFEEHFDTPLIERGERREGPIVKFSEDLSWLETVEYGTDQLHFGTFTASLIDGYSDDVAHGSAFERAAGLLESFRRGDRKTSDVFAAERLANFLAIKELLGSSELDWRDLRLYYDPVTSKLEPIAFDNHIREPLYVLFCHDGGIITKWDPERWQHNSDIILPKLLFKDPDFFALYVAALERVSAPGYVDALFADIDEELQKKLSVLYREHPYVQSPERELRQNQLFIRTVLHTSNPVHAYHVAVADGRLELAVGNIQSLPVEIVGVSVRGAAPIAPSAPVLLYPKRMYQRLELVSAWFQPPTRESWEAIPAADLTLHTRILGTRIAAATSIVPWSHLPPSIAEGDWMLQTRDLQAIPGLTVTERTIEFHRGTWVIDRNLILPPGYQVLAGPGVRLDLRAGAKILSYSPVHFHGSEAEPVVIESSDATGQGLVVLNTEARSSLQDVIFDNLGEPNEGGWKVPGSVTFYEADVDLFRVRFQRMRSEDALNVMRAAFEMRQTIFSDSQSDAFDGDFTTGLIEQCAFLRSTNDAIDLSGSRVEIRGLRINGAGDKAISVGESTDVVAEDIEIRNAEIGYASKDLSTIQVTDTRIFSTRVAFTAFRKKPQFGGGSITALDVTMEKPEEPYLIEIGSSMTLDGKGIPADKKNVETTLYGNQFGRSSK